MSKKKKSSHHDDISKILMITAIIELIGALIDIINKLTE